MRRKFSVFMAAMSLVGTAVMLPTVGPLGVAMLVPVVVIGVVYAALARRYA